MDDTIFNDKNWCLFYLIPISTVKGLKSNKMILQQMSIFDYYIDGAAKIIFFIILLTVGVSLTS